MTLAIFDLDNTLIGDDSDNLWGEFVCLQGIVPGADFRARNDQFYADYKAGNLDIDAYLRFALSPLIGVPRATRDAWHEEFMRTMIEPILLPAAADLIARHREQGHELVIITATNRFVTEPIAARLGIDQLIACEGEIVDDVYTGEPAGVPSYAGGKVTRLMAWLEERGSSMDGAWFYSDSHNDLPLLELVDNPVAVDPDETLRARAQEMGWPVISLRN
ncbi:MAG: HAD family hydrolase [Halioglobus sp.]|nr:HAD family hydrolase [Halioglobus sp.]